MAWQINCVQCALLEEPKMNTKTNNNGNQTATTTTIISIVTEMVKKKKSTINELVIYARYQILINIKI